MSQETITILVTILSMLIAYLFGSINFAIIITKLFINKDIREFGSGNAGMTNVLRTVGKTAASLTLLGDVSKGIVAVLIARLLFSQILGTPEFVLGEYLSAIGALLGHLFPIYYKFKGGKGILVSSGAMLMLAPIPFVLALVIFIITVVISKIVSLGSIISSISLVLFNFLFLFLNGNTNWPIETILSAIIASSIVLMHRENIKRLIKGEENKLGKSK